MQLRAVGHEQCNAVARGYAKLSEQGCAAVGEAVQFGIAEAVAVEVQGRGLRLQACPAPQVFAEGLLTVRVVRVAWHADRPGSGL